MTRPDDELKTIKSYVDQGWTPIPLHFVKDGAEGSECSCPEGAKCSSKGKHPAFAGWRDPVVINDKWWAWWATHPRPGVGLPTGRTSGFWVLDVDPRHGGDVYLAELEAEHGKLPDTRQHSTPSGGWHNLFELPADRTISNSRGLLDPERGLDVRGDGGQIAAPPSVGYGLGFGGDEVLPAPGWLLDLVAPRTNAPLAGDVLQPLTHRSGAPEADPSDDWTDAELGELAGAILEHEVDDLLGVTEGDRNAALNASTFAVATLIGCQGVPDDWEAVVREQMTTAGIGIGLGAGEVAKTVASGIRGGRAKPRTPDAEVEAYSWPPARKAIRVGLTEFSLETEKSGTEVSKVIARTQDDIGNGQRLRDWFGTVLRWVPERGAWSIYSGGRWSVSNERARGAVHRMFELALKHEALKYSDEVPEPERPVGEDGNLKAGRPKKPEATDREKFEAWLRKQRMSARIDACLKEAASMDGMSASILDFNAKPGLLNCPNGTIELDAESGPVLREFRPADLLTQMTAVPWVADADRLEWDTFLKRVMPDEAERAGLQAAAGYSIGGSTAAQVMFVHHGVGANGKSVFADVVSTVLGDMAQSTPRDTFAAHASDRHSTDVARMVGKRFVTTIEPRTGSGLDEDLVKQLTGGDIMAARFMRENSFEFRPTGKIHYFTNHLPRISADGAMWRRIRLFQWQVVIPEAERVGDLSGALAASGGEGVLAWLVEGYRAWRTAGLPTTATQRESVARWADEDDSFAMWLEERCVRTEGAFCPSAELFATWREYCEANGLMPGTSNAFGRRLSEKGFERAKGTNGIRGFTGLVRRVSWVAERDPMDPFG